MPRVEYPCIINVVPKKGYCVYYPSKKIPAARAVSKVALAGAYPVT